MPIVVQCGACKGKFQVQDQMAGKQAKCPSCQAVLVIPAPSGKPAPSAMDDLLDDEIPGRTGTAGVGQIKCPGCGAVTREDAVLCIDCGYDFRKGRKIIPDTPAERKARYEARDAAMRGQAPGAKKRKEK